MSTEQPEAEADLDALRDHRDAILRVARQRKATDIRVFGSLANGTVHHESDVDFLVSMDPDATLVDLIGLEQDLEVLLGREVDVVTDGELRSRFKDEVQSSAVPL
jgi:predicted nucleotidyltransferase